MVATGRRQKLRKHTRARLPDVKAELVYIDEPCVEASPEMIKQMEVKRSLWTISRSDCACRTPFQVFWRDLRDLLAPRTRSDLVFLFFL